MPGIHHPMAVLGLDTGRYVNQANQNQASILKSLTGFARGSLMYGASNIFQGLPKMKTSLTFIERKQESKVSLDGSRLVPHETFLVD